MSGIEKTCRLSLALDRVYRHGDLFLNDKIATKEMQEAIEMLQKAIGYIPNWEEFIEQETHWWIDLINEKAND